MSEESLKAIGVMFNGMQERPYAPAIPLYTDLVTRTTFGLEEGESLTEAVARKRKGFRVTSSDEVSGHGRGRTLGKGVTP